MLCAKYDMFLHNIKIHQIINSIHNYFHDTHYQSYWFYQPNNRVRDTKNCISYLYAQRYFQNAYY